MSKIVTLQHHQITDLAAEVAHKVGTATFHKRQAGATINLFGIPRGGVPAAYAVAMEYIRTYGWCYVTDDPNEADVFIDDIVDSGATMQRWADKYPGKHFFALVDKTDPALPPELNAWVVFPWETGEDGDAEDNVRRLLQFIGEDPKRGGLLETPKRVIKAWKFWTSGYGQDPKDVLKTFEDGAEGCDEMVIRRGIPVYSHCEHHMAAIIGEATVAYIPRGKVVGLSKLDRVVNIYARRLQVQERMTNQIADALQSELAPKGIGVLIKARHMCIESRGVCHGDSMTITSALRGVIKEDARARAEFLKLCNKE